MTMHGEKDQSAHSRSVDDDNNNKFFNFESRIPTDVLDIIEMVQGIEKNVSDNLKKFKLLLEDAEKPLYKGCHKYTK